MATRRIDLKKELERMKKPAAGYPVYYPPKDAELEKLWAKEKKKKLPPAWR